jgi:uncharacterized protein with HXXEE motif
MDDRAFWRLPFRNIIWLLPAAFVLHIAEEYLGGFPSWVTNVLGGSFNNVAFALNNAAFMAVMLALTLWASRSGSRVAAFLLIAWASGNVFWDALFHVLTTAGLDRYSPGLISSAILYLPIWLVVGWSALQNRALGLGRSLVPTFVAWLFLGS